MAEPQEVVAPAAEPAPAAVGNQHSAHVKLAVFWPQNPALWFAQAECQFQVKDVVSALPHDSLRLVADLVEAPPTETIYDDIKQQLVASHQFSDFQKAQKLFLMQSLGGAEAVGDDGRHVRGLSPR